VLSVHTNTIGGINYCNYSNSTMLRKSAKDKFFEYICRESWNSKGTSNLITSDNTEYYIGDGYPIEYSEGNFGKIPLYAITVIYAGSMVNDFSCCFTKKWKAMAYLQCLIDGGINKQIKGENLAIITKNHYLN